MVDSPEIKRDKNLIIPMSDTEIGKIKKEANRLGMPVTSFIRFLLREWFKEKVLSWEQIIEIEPELNNLYLEAKNYQVGKNYDRDHTWYREFKPRMILLVGMMAKNPIISTSSAYDTCYFKISEALPKDR